MQTPAHSENERSETSDSQGSQSSEGCEVCWEAQLALEQAHYQIAILRDRLRTLQDQREDKAFTGSQPFLKRNLRCFTNFQPPSPTLKDRLNAAQADTDITNS